MRQPRAEVDAGQVLNLADEARALAFRQAAGGKQAVDEQSQLGVGERALDVPAGAEGAVLAVGAGARPLVAADGIAAGLQFQQVAPDRLAVGGHPVFGLEQPQELLLGEAVVFVGILAQQLQQVEREHLFRLQGICHIGASFRKEFCRAAAMRDHVPARRRCETAAVRNRACAGSGRLCSHTDLLSPRVFRASGTENLNSRCTDFFIVHYSMRPY